MADVDLAAACEFTYTSTLDRNLVNRRAVSEVFLTDFHPISDTECIVGAQLPLSHAYFSDHIACSDSYDVTLILECCRQAATYGGYKQFGNPIDMINMVSSLHLGISEPCRMRVTDTPGRLVIHVRVKDIVRAGNRVRSGTPQMTMFLDGYRIGNASIPVTLASSTVFRALRARMRHGPPVYTTSLVVPDAPAVDPGLVGRSRPRNVLLAGPQMGEAGATALLRLGPENRNILDHEYDHIPAMALTEAAIQLMTWHTGHQRNAISAIDATFDRFTEVDIPVCLTGTTDDSGMYKISFAQNNAMTGTTFLTLGAEFAAARQHLV